ncbi:LysR family transcriptional regulator [Oxalobacteraceae bacterium CAVE-383]|nr:LysR family transcriptional regulator [Oxalobacteraceae bacterium CAVE-383]
MNYLTHLRTFLDVYRSQSFSRAAEHLGITQPAASLHVQALEALVGEPLFIRRARGVTATGAADELAQSVGAHIDELETTLASYRSPRMTSLNASSETTV